VLVFSFIGYASYEVKVNGQTVIDVALESDIKSLNEVIVHAGYWDVKEKEQTGNISRITADQISKQPVSNPLQALEGRMAGVYVQQSNGIPGSNFTIKIRGQNSITSGNDPLFVVDGVPFTPGNLSSTSTSANILGTSGVSPLNSINPSDIESIEVLKDADATAIYGSRGANGVVLITTKKGKASGKVTFDLNIFTGSSRVGHTMDMLSTPQYVAVRREAFANDHTTPDAGNAPDMVAWDTTRYTDWQKKLIGGVASFTNAQTSLSGGNENTQFSWSGGLENQGTVFPGDLSSNKLFSKISSSHVSTNKKFKGSVSGIYALNKSNLINNDFTIQALRLSPNSPDLYKTNSELNWENSTWQNPLSELEKKYKAKINNLIANANLSYQLIKGVEVGLSLGFNDIRMTDKNMTPSKYYDPVYAVTPQSDELYLNNSSSQSWIIEPKISWEKKIGKGKLSSLIGSTFQERVDEKNIQYGTGFTSDALIESISAAATTKVTTYSNTIYRYDAFFGRINYQWNEKYFINLTGRRDGSSRFGPGNRFGNFGAVGVAWIFSKESFTESALPFLSFGKLRSSYGVTGNDQIGDYQYLSTFQPSGAAYQSVVGLAPTRLYNPNFAWEANHKFEAAIALGFLRDHISLSASYYNNRSSNQLVNYPLAMTTGFTGVLENMNATVQNSGWEFVLNTLNVGKNDLTWNTSLNLTLPTNTLIAFPQLANSTYANKYVIGEPLTISKRYAYNGIDPATGVYQFRDYNQDGSITSVDRMKVENIGQKFYGGVDNTIKIRQFQFSIFFQFVKQTGINYFGTVTNTPGFQTNQPVQILNNRWTSNDTYGKDIQRFTMGNNAAAVSAFFNTYVSSDAVVVDASFVRLKNVSISYELPSTWAKSVKARLYVQGQNLLTFTNYLGLDPENYNSYALPPLRTYVAGVQLTL
jgi:TonB-linked SusC/RagA family outer membrane protein